jgi:hypothetical protein
MKTMIYALTLAVVVVVAGVAGCTGSIPSDPAGIVGAVTSIQPGSGDVVATMLVEGGEQVFGAVSDKAQVAVVRTTRIYAADGSRIQAAQIDAGATVRVWFDGAVAESYPVQGTAEAIQLTE